jgi:hypothetical protein
MKEGRVGRQVERVPRKEQKEDGKEETKGREEGKQDTQK